VGRGWFRCPGAVGPGQPAAGFLALITEAGDIVEGNIY